MRTMHFIAAALQFDDVLSQWGALSAATRERLIVFAAVGLVTVLVLAWVVFFRKSRRRQHGRHHSHHHAQAPPGAQRLILNQKAAKCRFLV